MSARRLRWLAVIVPVVAIGVLDLITDHEWDDLLVKPLNTLAIPLVVLAFAIVFARFAFRRIDELVEAARERSATLERRNAALEALRDVSRAITAFAPTEDVFRAVVEKAHALLDSDVACISLVGPDGTHRLAARQGPAEAFPSRDEPPLDPRDLVRADYLASPLATPLLRGTMTVGALTVGRRSSRSAYRPEDVELLALLAGGAAIAFENERLQRELRELAIRSERERIAREMHDGLAQILGYVNTKAQAVEELLALGQADAARRQLAQLAAAARSVYVDVREAILGLTSPVAVDRGLAGALEEYAVRFAEASKLAATVEATPAARALRLPPEVEAHVFHIAQEALTNVRKHAAARRVRLRLEVDDRSLLLAIEDDGAGFDPAAAPTSDWPHYGMRSMRERAASIGAAVDWSAGREAGTTFRLRVPLGLDRGAG